MDIPAGKVHPALDITIKTMASELEM